MRRALASTALATALTIAGLGLALGVGNYVGQAGSLVGGLSAAQTERRSVQVVRVVDGDTVIVDLDGAREYIRVIGLNTPETVAPGTPVQCGGPEASAQAHALMDGQRVTLETDPSQDTRDRYDRLLAYVYLPDGRDFSAVMISGGYGQEYTYKTRYSHQATFRAAEATARKERLGGWATCGWKP